MHQEINDLRDYENDLNFKGINFPVKVRHKKVRKSKSRSTRNKCIFS